MTITPSDGASGVQVLDPDGDTLLEVRPGEALGEQLSGPTQAMILAAIADVGRSFVTRVSSETGSATVPIAGAASVSSAEAVLGLAGDDVGLRRSLDPKRTQAIQRAAGRVIARLVHNAYERDITDAQLEDDAQAAVDTFELLLSGNARQLESVMAALDAMPARHPDEIDVDEARSRARWRLQALYRKIMGESLTASQLADWGLSRQRLQQLRAGDQVFAIKVPYHREFFHPEWQFGPDHAPRKVMPALLAAAKDAGLDAIAFHQLMTGERAGGLRGVELLDAGDEQLALALVRASDR